MTYRPRPPRPLFPRPFHGDGEIQVVGDDGVGLQVGQQIGVGGGEDGAARMRRGGGMDDEEPQLVGDDFGRGAVERRGPLVGEQDGGARGEEPGEVKTEALPGGECVGRQQQRSRVGEAGLGEDGDGLGEREIGEGIGEGGGIIPIAFRVPQYEGLAPIRRDPPAERAQERGFARTGISGEENDLPRLGAKGELARRRGGCGKWKAEHRGQGTLAERGVHGGPIN